MFYGGKCEISVECRRSTATDGVSWPSTYQGGLGSSARSDGDTRCASRPAPAQTFSGGQFRKIALARIHPYMQVNPDIRKEKWTADEDKLLATLVAEHGNRWADIARQCALTAHHDFSRGFELSILSVITRHLK